MCVLCMSRNQEEGHGLARSIGQDCKDNKREEREVELLKKLQRADVRPGPDVRRLKLQRADVRHLKAEPTQVPADKSYSKRTPGLLWMTGNTSQRADARPQPDDGHLHTQAKSAKVRNDQTTGDQTTGRLRTSDTTSTERN